MQASPNGEPIVLSQEDIDAKYDQLELRLIFNDNTIYRLEKVTEGTGNPPSKHQKAGKFDWHWESYVRKTDEKVFAIVKWRRLLAGGEDFHVLQFWSLDGRLYITPEVGPDLLGA